MTQEKETKFRDIMIECTLRVAKYNELSKKEHQELGLDPEIIEDVITVSMLGIKSIRPHPVERDWCLINLGGGEITVKITHKELKKHYPMILGISYENYTDKYIKENG